MRSLLALTALALLAVAPGCGDDTTTAASIDMAMPHDLSAAAGDMAKIQNCAGILSCAFACGTDQTCAAACIANAVTAAQTRFGALSACVLETCGPGDGGMHSCPVPPDNSTTCTNCIQSVGQAAALNASAPCHAEYTACASN
jgi:hypothetical protein